MGRALLVCGSRGMAGAAVLAAEAVLRGGAGYVVVAAPASLAPELAAALPAALTLLCGPPDRSVLGEEDLSRILPELQRAQAWAVGPGIGREASTARLLAGLLASAPRPAILDADALNLLAEEAGGLRLADLPAGTLLTPHPGEAARLLGLDGALAVQRDRPAALAALCDRSPAVVLLKGAGTLIGVRGRETWRNPTGNPGMATAGSGDVLTGLLTALRARGLDAWDAARLGAWLHGRAGDFAREELGEEAMIASDLLRFLPRAFRDRASTPSVA